MRGQIRTVLFVALLEMTAYSLSVEKLLSKAMKNELDETLVLGKLIREQYSAEQIQDIPRMKMIKARLGSILIFFARRSIDPASIRELLLYCELMSLDLLKLEVSNVGFVLNVALRTSILPVHALQ